MKQTWLGKSNVFNFHYYSFTLFYEWIFLRQRLKAMREKKKKPVEQSWVKPFLILRRSDELDKRV